ncbi:MAG: hypothetical protein EOP56_15390 [Sphingobacteriales bacterium]|nr:MAG: hypothetical protein EOP56_15390 [Sphingobacteriales bacterium]
MGCGNCGTGTNGKPGGCNSGGCSSGGCNRMNVFDWLSALPLHDSAKPYPVIEVTFNKGSRKEFYRNNSSLILEKGEWIAVEGVSGFDLGQVSVTGELVKLQMKKHNVEEQAVMKRVLRQATNEDFDLYNKHKVREPELLTRSRTISRNLNLDMKLCEVEIQADGRKATFFYTADQRVDFRELIKLYASDFKVKVEMRQIGARQESGKVGGIGSCGRELCCSTWLSDFKSVNTTAARYQNLSINQTKLSGQCGRLKCCLNYELDTYLDALRVFPDHAETLQTIKGNATLQKKDIFKNLMWYSYSDSSKQYPLTIVRVKEILKANKEGVKPDELQPVELETSSNKAGLKVDIGFVNDVGQITLKNLEKSSRRKGKGGGGNKPQQQQGNRPQQQGGGVQGQQGGGNRPQQQVRPQQGSRPQQGGSDNDPDQPKQNQPKPQGNREGGNNNRPQRPQGNRPQQQGGAQGQQGEGGNKPQQQQGGGQNQGEKRPQQSRQRNPNPQQKPQGQGQPKPEQGQQQAQPQQQQGQGQQQGQQQQGQGKPQQQNRPQQNRPPQGSKPQHPHPKQQGPNQQGQHRNREQKPKQPNQES